MATTTRASILMTKGRYQSASPLSPPLRCVSSTGNSADGSLTSPPPSLPHRYAAEHSESVIDGVYKSSWPALLEQRGPTALRCRVLLGSSLLCLPLALRRATTVPIPPARWSTPLLTGFPIGWGFLLVRSLLAAPFE